MNLSQKSLFCSFKKVNSSPSSSQQQPPQKKWNVNSKKRTHDDEFAKKELVNKGIRDALEARLKAEGLACAKKDEYHRRFVKKYPKVSPEYKTCTEECRKNLTYFFSDEKNSWLAPIIVLLGWYSVKKLDMGSSEIGDPFATMDLVYGCAFGDENNFDFAELCLQLVRKLFPIIYLADFYQFAGVVALQSIGGPAILFHPRREDDDDLTKITSRQMVLCGRDLVALSAAYDLGIRSASASAFASGDFTPVFDNSYFKELLSGEKESGEKEDLKPSHKSLLDKALLEDPVFRGYVDTYAEDQKSFFEDYASAHLKLSELGYFDA